MMRKKFKILITFILFFAFFLFLIVNIKLVPIVSAVAEEETNSLGSIFINSAITKYISKNLDFNKLYMITYNENNEIETIDLDTVVVNRLITNINEDIQNNIKLLELGKIGDIDLNNNKLIRYAKKNKNSIIYELPLSLAPNNPILAQISPKIPIKINMIGNVNSAINNKIKDYGINNVLLETYLDIEVTLQVILPFRENKTNVKNRIPIGIKIIKGKVPDYYSGAKSDFSIPIK